MPQQILLPQVFTVPFEFKVIFAGDVLSSGDRTLSELIDSSGTRRVAAFIDAGLHAAQPKLFEQIIRTLGDRLVTMPQIVPGGEAGKQGMDNVQSCARILHEAKIDRHAYVIAIGGGAMLDVVGFAAAIVHRGVRMIRIPTTVLAQNDAGIGVKNGVNGFGKKNFFGTFAPPYAVINDFTLLRTLSPEQWRDGTAEAVKVGLIRDRAFFEWIEAHVSQLNQREPEAFRYLIRRCAELHLQHITGSGDPFERGSARPLDFGHWAAHRLESISNFKLSHGHAVAIGMAIDMTYASRTGICSEATAARVIDCLRGLQFPFAIADVEPDAVLAGLAEFQEHLGGELSLAMVREPGERVEIHAVDLDVMCSSVGDVLSSWKSHEGTKEDAKKKLL